MNHYHPTVWRTCRVLANAHRLACLKAVLQHPGGCVGEIATQIGAGMVQTSLSLRMLQARGLLSARRDSRWVRYHPEPDPLVPAATPILGGLRRAIMHDKTPTKQILRCMTAFTHPRRLVILRFLQNRQAVTSETLVAKCRISAPALYRHLKKLQARGLVSSQDNRWTLCRRQCALTRVFLALIAHDPECRSCSRER